jgi:hypothetical protein
MNVLIIGLDLVSQGCFANWILRRMLMSIESSYYICRGGVVKEHMSIYEHSEIKNLKLSHNKKLVFYFLFFENRPIRFQNIK